MARKPNPYLTDDDNPELTAADFAEMRPTSEVLPPEVFAELTKRKPGQRGPGKKRAKVQVTMRLDPDAVEAFRATGPGWQARVNEAVMLAAAKLQSRAAPERRLASPKAIPTGQSRAGTRQDPADARTAGKRTA